MLIQELLERVEIEPGRVANPLGVPPSDIYDVMDEIYDVEVRFYEQINKHNDHLSSLEKIQINNKAIEQIGKPLRMPIDKLIPMEPTLDAEHLKREDGNKLPIVYLYNNQYYISDGNHRVARAHMRGETHTMVLVVDVNELAKSAEEMGK